MGGDGERGGVGRAKSLYVHVPFCVSRCDYCDFASGVYDRDLAAGYLDALERELSERAGDAAFETVYVGGGTPTALDNDHLERLIALLRPRVGGPECEFTIEANPGTVDDAKALLLSARGVNRVSLGVQSFSDARLKMLGRAHTADEARAAFGALRGRDFENISIDLMTALPEVTSAEAGPAEADLAEAVRLAPEHVSVYILSVEPGTKLAGRVDSGELTPAPDERAAAEYHLARERLTAAGYAHYEISNFARPGLESRHNTVYWTARPYLGVGASAASFSGWSEGRPGLRTANVRDAHEYARRVMAGNGAVASVERLPHRRAAREALILGLRMLGGVDSAEFRRTTGVMPEEICGDGIRSAVERGLLEEERYLLRLTSRGLVVSDSVMAELV